MTLGTVVLSTSERLDVWLLGGGMNALFSKC